MEGQVDNAIKIYRMFTDPGSYALDNIRKNTLITFKWTLAFLGTMLGVSYFIESKNVTAIGKSMVQFSFILNSFGAAYILRKFYKSCGIDYIECSLLYLTNLCVMIIALIAMQLFTPGGGAPSGLSSVFSLIFLYFVIFASPKMLSALTGQPKSSPIIGFLAPYILCYFVIMLIGAAIVLIGGKDLPITKYILMMP